MSIECSSQRLRRLPCGKALPFRSALKKFREAEPREGINN